MNKTPLVSIIIPTHNRGHILPRAVESILCQTYQNIELIIVDDASKDNTPEVMKDYSQKDKRIINITNSRNLGKVGALNAGIKMAKGEFMIIFDDDYEALPQRIEKELSVMNSFSPPLDILISNLYLEKANARMVMPPRLKSKSVTLRDILSCRYSSGDPSAWFCRTSSVRRLKGFDETLAVWEDVDFFFRALMNNYRIYFLNQPLSIRHCLPGMSSICAVYLSQKEKFLAKHLSFLEKHKKYLSRLYYCFGKDYFKLGEFRQARDYFWQSFFLEPLRLEYLVKIIRSYFFSWLSQG